VPAFAAAGRAATARLLRGAQHQAEFDRHLLPAWRTAANPPHAAAAVDILDRHTGRRTDTVPLHRPCFSYYVGSANNTAVMAN